MRKFIDAEQALEHIRQRLYESAINNTNYECKASEVFEVIADSRIQVWIDELNAVDVACPIKCKNCKYYTQYEHRLNVCIHSSGCCDAKPESFCSFAEKREDE